MNKKVIVHTRTREPFTTTKGEINYLAWGITATIQGEGVARVVHIPWTNIEYVEEFTS